MIKDLKEFEKLLKICRRQGVADITIEGITLKFGAMPNNGDIESEEPEVSGADHFIMQQLGLTS